MWMPEETRPQRRGMFGGGRGKNVLGAIAEAMATFSAGMGNPAGMAVMQNIQGRRQSQQRAADEAAQYERQRADALDDYRAKKGIDAEFGGAPNNDTVNDYEFIRQQLGEDAAKNYLRNLGDPMVTVQLPGNRVYSGPRSQMGSALGGGAAPAASIDAQPGEEDGYIYTPGPGGRANQSNWKPKGGQPVAPAGGFPRPF